MALDDDELVADEALEFAKSAARNIESAYSCVDDIQDSDLHDKVLGQVNKLIQDVMP